MCPLSSCARVRVVAIPAGDGKARTEVGVRELHPFCPLRGDGHRADQHIQAPLFDLIDAFAHRGNPQEIESQPQFAGHHAPNIHAQPLELPLVVNYEGLGAGHSHPQAAGRQGRQRWWLLFVALGAVAALADLLATRGREACAGPSLERVFR